MFKSRKEFQGFLTMLAVILFAAYCTLAIGAIVFALAGALSVTGAGYVLSVGVVAIGVALGRLYHIHRYGYLD